MALAHHSFNPYPGLRSFEPEESELFFGREKQIAELVTRLDRTRFLAVVGTSGCGKSSLVRAGLLPQLSNGHEGIAGKEWRTLLFKPGNDPYRYLADAFLGKDEVTGEIPELKSTSEAIEEQLRSDENGLIDFVRKNHGVDRNLLIVVDQFEELFTFHTSDTQELASSDSKGFVARLLQGVLQSEVPIYLLLTMRSDFLGNCTAFDGLTESINNGQFLIPRMTLQERKDAILGPLKISDGAITDRLLDRIMKEAGEGQDQLPILQHTLMRMWDHWKESKLDDQPLDYHEYESVGGIENALSRHAEEAFAELDSDRQKRLAEVLFKALTDLGNDNRGTRRPTPLKEICALAESTEEEMIEVAEIFRTPGRAFLMPPNKLDLSPSVILDISHESLMRKWVRLRKWVEEEIKSAELYLRLCNSAALYQEGKAGLLGNPELQLGLNWQMEAHPNLTWASRYDVNFERALNFLAHSESEYNRAVLIKENRAKRELSRAKRFTIILGVASIISLLFLLLAFNLKFKAEDSEQMALKQANLADRQSEQALERTKEAMAQKRISEQQQEIAAQQRLIAERNRNLAMVQSDIAQKNEGIANEQRGIAQNKEKEAVIARDDAKKSEEKAVAQKEIAEENRVKAEKSEAKTERLRLQAIARNIAITSYNLDKKEQPDLVKLLAGQAYQFNLENGGSFFEPDIYKALVYATDDEEVKREHGDAVRTMAISKKNGKLLTGSENGEVLLWDAGGTGTPKLLVPAQKDASIRSVVHDEKGNWIAAGDYHGNILIWAGGGNATPKTNTSNTGIVTGLAFNPKLDYLFSTSADSTVRSIDLKNPEASARVIVKMDARVDALAISPDGNYMMAGARSGQFKLYDLHNGEVKALYSGRSKSGGVTSLSFSSDSKSLAMGTSSGKVLLYSVSAMTKAPLQMAAHSSPVSDLDFHPERNRLVSASLDGAAKLWNLDDQGSEPIIVAELDDWIWSVAFSPKGDKIAIGGQDKSIRWQSSETENMVDKICPDLKRNLNKTEWTRYIGTDIKYRNTCSDLPTGDTGGQ